MESIEALFRRISKDTCEVPYKKEGKSVHVVLFLLAMHFKTEHVMTLQKNTNTLNRDSHYPDRIYKINSVWNPKQDYFPDTNYTGLGDFPHFFKPYVNHIEATSFSTEKKSIK